MKVLGLVRNLDVSPRTGTQVSGKECPEAGSQVQHHFSQAFEV